MKYTIIISKSVQKQISRLSNELQKRVIGKISGLQEEPRPTGIVKMKGYSNEYRLRVGNYRIRYEIDDSQRIIKILQCKHRREVYRQ